MRIRAQRAEDGIWDGMVRSWLRRGEPQRMGLELKRPKRDPAEGQPDREVLETDPYNVSGICNIESSLSAL